MEKEIAKAYGKLVWAVVFIPEAKLLSLINENEQMLHIRECDTERINEVIEMLGERRSGLLKMHFGLLGKEFSAKEISEKLGVTTSCVYHNLKKSLKLLRHPSKNYVFRRLFRSALEDCISSQASYIRELNKKVSELQKKLKRFEGQREQNALKEETGEKSFLTIDIHNLGFSRRVLHHLLNQKVKTVGDLIKKTEKELLAPWGFGRKCLCEVRDRLEDFGLSLAG